MTSTTATRSKTEFYLVGQGATELLGAKLPSHRQVFSLFLHFHLTEKQTLRSAAKEVIDQVLPFWEKARIPTRASQHCIKKLEKLYQEWTKMKKHKDRETQPHKDQEAAFVGKLDDLFDIAHSDAMNIMKIQEDRDFLTAQRDKGRPGVMGSVDMVLTGKEHRAIEKAEKESRRRKKVREEQESVFGSTSTADVWLSSSSSSPSESEDDTEFHGAVCVIPSAKRAKKNIMTPGLMATLDRTKLSSRQAAFVLAETAKSLGHDISELNVNRMSIHRHRQKNRAKFVSEYKQNFHCSGPITVHWDGKLMLDLTGRKHVDRLPVIVTGDGVRQMLGVPKLAAGTAEAQACAVMDCLEEWKLCDNVSSLCFDTTSSNTGKHGGACVLLERKIGRELLHLACRHHIMELVLSAAFKTVFGTSSGPDVLLFKRFRDQWDKIDKENFQPAATDEYVSRTLSPFCKDIMEFINKQLLQQQVRDDYRELLELSIIFIGEIPIGGVKFKAPGATHHARWMAKLLYALKIWMFRNQFRLTPHETRGLRDLAIFAVTTYLKAWFTAPLAASAPCNDFLFLNQLLQYHSVHPAISSATSTMFSRHLWYLSEELVCLALFDDNVTAENKARMVHALQRNVTYKPAKRASVDKTNFSMMTLDNFVTRNSMKLFHNLSLPTDFLSADTKLWTSDEQYRFAQSRVFNLQVVNDHAERGVALIQDYNCTLTKDEEQVQFLLQVVADHRRLYPRSTKNFLISCKSSSGNQES